MDASKLLPALRRTFKSTGGEDGSIEEADLSMESTLLDNSHDGVELMEEAEWEASFELFKPSSGLPFAF